jgi:hypothetical protein
MTALVHVAKKNFFLVPQSSTSGMKIRGQPPHQEAHPNHHSTAEESTDALNWLVG